MFKQDLFAQFARIGKALSNGNRLEILEYLAQAERSVEKLAQVSGLSVANTSQHLQQLRQVGLVSSSRQGLRVFYRISGDDVVDLLNVMRRVGERHLADVNQLVSTFLTVKDELEAVPREVLMARVAQGLVTVIDVRPVEEFAAGHLPGAINIPPDELEQRLQALDAQQEVVAYCRGPHCIMSFNAVEKLRQTGVKASRLEDGFPEWKSAGYPVELSA
ncbi:Transcriptional regulator, ArsR family [hydrothermal vent metagenome]|uniref:Transcriptional regulator, ArsR family n=1 Tax=hydrothermal vent metagenome TaxID=652676 RepID=A0A3B0XGP0_9ZZZZ